MRYIMRLLCALFLLFGCALGCSLAEAQPLNDGRLSLTPSPYITGDVTGAATLYYTDGINTFSEAGPWAVGPRDAFFSGSALCTEPWVSRATLPPQPVHCTGTYVGSTNPDADGLLNEHVTVGAPRRWDVFNDFNQVDIDLQIVDGTSNQQFTKSQANWTPITPNSYGVIIIGTPTSVANRYHQSIYTLASASGGSAWGIVAIGWGPSFANPVPFAWPGMAGQPPGTWGQTGVDNYAGGAQGPSTTPAGDYTANAFMGTQTVYAVICANTIITPDPLPPGQGPSVVTFMGKNPPVERIMHIRFQG